MSLETDLLIDRRRLKRRLWLWRAIAAVAVLGCVLLLVGRFAVVPRPHVTRVNVSGIITDSRKLNDAVLALAKDGNVKAVLLAVDSPGGSVAGGESLHAVLSRVAAAKPLVTVMGGTAASAGYMIAMPSARIFARPSTITGSIGVLLETGEASGLLNKLGVTAEAITSGPLKDQPSMVRPLTDQGRDVLHGLVMDMYDQFVGMVAAGRHMSEDKVRSLADGRAYTGRQALALGLVDEMGGEAEAREWLSSQRGIPAALPVEDVRMGTLAERTFGNALLGLTGDLLKSVLHQGVNLDGAWAVWQPARNGE